MAEWHDLEAPLPQGLAAARGHVVQPAGPEDPQTQGPASQGAPHRPAPRVGAHPAHRALPHGSVPHEGGRHSQEGGPDHRHFCGSEEAEQVVPLQTHPLPQEALGPQEGRQFC
uniref:Uncharacterized protein n=1 Tax=Papio anubis TaxID=9555 RepID=A0A8I5NJL1_PAPAN